MFGIFERFYDNPLFRWFAVAMFAVCFIEMVRRCIVHFNATRSGKLEQMEEEQRAREEAAAAESSGGEPLQ